MEFYKNEYNLDCAYFDINGYYIGCICNFVLYHNIVRQRSIKINIDDNINGILY